MNFVDILFLGLALSLDSFAIALSLSLSADCANRFLKFRYILTIALLHFVMPVVGWGFGGVLSSLLSSYSHWVAFLLLLYLGVKMIYDAAYKEEGCVPRSNALSLAPMLIMAITVSVDALLSGVSFSFIGVELLSASKLWSVVLGSLVIGVEAFFITWLGFVIGDKLSQSIGRKTPMAGGILLILLGLKILLNI